MTTDTFWGDVNDCQTSLTAVYNGLRNTDIYQFGDENQRSDIAIQGNVSRTGFTSTSYLQSFNDASTVPNNKWAAIYEGVFRANQLIEGLETVKSSVTESQEEEWTLIKAQAYALRGVFYFYLHNTFNGGEVPILDYVPKTVDEFFQPVSTSDEVENFYRNDFTYALELGLPDSWTESSDLGRIGAGAVKSFLGMSYLYAKDYDTAKEYFKEIIDSSSFSLVGIDENSTTKSEFNSESIFEISYSLDHNTEYGNYSDYFLGNIYGMCISKCKGWLSVTPAFWLIETYETEEPDALDPNNWIELTVDQCYQSSDTAENLTYSYQPDIYYQICGEDAIDISTSSDGSYTETAYVYTQLSKTYVYASKIYKRVINYDAEGVISGTPTYTIVGTWLTCEDFAPFESDGKTYMVQRFSDRASTYFVANNDIQTHYYQDPVNTNAAFNVGDAGYFRKYSNWDIWESEQDGSPQNASAINLRIIRLADIYLMYAEALIEGGDNDGGVAQALTYINRVRRRAGATLLGSEYAVGAEYAGIATYEDTNNDSLEEGEEAVIPMSTAAEVMEHLMYVERPLELALDGHALRATDLRRWGVTKERFESLSKQKFVLTQTSYLTRNATTGLWTLASNWGKQYRYEDYIELYPTATPNVYADYETAAINFSDSKAYWPIPSVEKNGNPYIN